MVAEDTGLEDPHSSLRGGALEGTRAAAQCLSAWALWEANFSILLWELGFEVMSAPSPGHMGTSMRSLSPPP